MNQIATTERNPMNSVAIATGANGSSIAPQSLGDVVRFAEVMCRADIALPKHLRGNAGACMAVALQALEWQMSPFAVASKSYAVNGAIAYEAQLIAAVVNTRSGIKGRLRYEFIGEGNDLFCKVTGVLDGEECEYETPPIGSITTKNSPLWKSDPRQQLGYFAARSWARRHCPEVILGVYDRDEASTFQGPDNAKDITPSLAQRLAAAKTGPAEAPQQREGFDPDFVTRETAALTGEPDGGQTEDNSSSADASPADQGNPRICSVDGCEREIECRELCGAHYKRLLAHGSPTGGRATMTGEPRKFFNDVVVPYTGDDCLIWPYARGSSGRAEMYQDGSMAGVHRLACIAVHGEPPSSKHEAAHNCGKGHEGCVNPRHLRWATKEENEADKVAHGTVMRGEDVPSAKLTEDQVREILRMSGDVSIAEMARRFGVGESTVRSIVRREKWAWLDSEASSSTSTVAADPSDDEPATEEGDYTGQVSSEAAPSSTYTRADCIRAFMNTATNAELNVVERRQLLEDMKEMWKEALSDDLDFVKACLQTADKVAKGELAADAARKYLEAHP